MSERRLIQTLCVGPQSERWGALSEPLMRRYAARVGATLHVERASRPHPEINDPFTRLQLSKLDLMRDGLTAYGRVLWLDIDVLVRPDSPDLFALVPASHWAALDECAMAYTTPGWLPHVAHCHQHMKTVCEQDGLPIPDTQGRYFNCGVQLASPCHSFLYEPALHPDDFGWAEQSRVNVRLFLRPETPIYYLPECWNRTIWFGTHHYQRTSYFIHYCGANVQDRAALMQRDLALWRQVYPELNHV